MALMKELIATRGGSAVVLVRILVGWVFVSEGIGKFLYAGEQGAARFARIPAIPAPHVMAPFVGAVEVVFGVMILAGLLTRLAAIPLLINIGVAIVTTKLPILAGHSYGVPKQAHYNLWGMLHEARTDFSMFLGLLFLLISGGGRWSVDAWLLRKRG